MALPQARSTPGTALTASGAKVTRDAAPRLRAVQQPWQSAALTFYDTIGEVKVGAHFYSRMLQRLRIYAARRIDDDRVEPIKEGLPVDLLNRIQDPGGGRTKILKDYGRLMFLTGEGYLLGRGFGEREHWSFVWREELRFDDSGTLTHILSPNVPLTDFSLVGDDDYQELSDGDAVAYRFWTPHPRFSWLADSPMRSTLKIAEELDVLTSSVYATATSRLVRSKVLLMPQEMSPGPVMAPGRSEDPKNDPFAEQVGMHFSRALEDPSAPESLAPFIIWGMSDYLQYVRDISMHDTETDYLEKDLRKETIHRLALGWDMPPEALEGLSDANHWSAWAVREDMWVLHGAPMAEQFCDDLGEAYLLPALERENYQGWEEVVVAFDETNVVVNPDRSKDADEAWDRGAISYGSYRNAKRFKESDAPPDDEYANWLAIKLRNPALVEGVEGADQNGNGTDPNNQGVPPGQPGDVSESTNLPEEASLWGAAQLAVIRCRELAGSRLRSRHDSCPECLEAAKDVPNALLTSTLSREAWEQLGMIDPADLVKGGADSFRVLASTWGMGEVDVTELAGRIEEHAAQTLFQADPKPLVKAG